MSAPNCNNPVPKGLHTACVRGGAAAVAGSHEPHVLHAHTFPIFQTSTFVFDDTQHGADLFGKRAEGHMYSRIGNPTVERLESLVAELEHGCGGVAVASGMAAVTAATIPFLRAGDHVVCSQVMYGPSVSLLSAGYARFGINCSVIDTTNTETVRATVRKGETKVLYVETPGNPMTTITDLRSCAQIAHEAGAVLVVDNTFASPIFQNPLVLGADVVLHSITKYLNGHGDVVGGIVVAKSPEHAAAIRTWRKDTGSIMGPFDAFLVTRGIRTLAMRMQRHTANADAVARFLVAHPKVTSVTWPGLETNAGHKLACEQMHGGFGGTFSFTVAGGYEAAKRVIEACRFATLAVSLGCLDTLIEHPASMTHASVPAEIMKEQGLCPELIRISVGTEDVEDIVEDLRQALTHA
eukprot:m51a1_g259 putative methionine gamma-lyase (409) ;mRNA; r:220341-222145